ncbi:MAG TPA: glutamate--tRNA ligase [Pirellulaceae bacterium]|nr:glutamate--tRNA ligase [Pirellulaceae bacterium]
MTVRTRFAPSPTGYLHIGGVRTALFNWLFSRQHGGQFLLRIDDTDQQRNVAEALQPILDGFKWLGIDWDEGPEIGGPYAPYFQSQRLARYQAAVAELLARGAAYRDYATPEELQNERQTAEREKRIFIYSRRWAAETDEDARRFEAEGRKGVVRLRMPREGQCQIHDLVRGDVSFAWADEQDHVIQRADGTCLYHLASAIDDHDFRITHVIRAVEHLSNTPRQIFIMQSLGYPLPEFAHLPYVAEPGSSNKLSKRKIAQYLKHADFKKLHDHALGIAQAIKHPVAAETFNPVIVDFYRVAGYQPDAIINYLLLLGWSFDDKKEEFTRDEMVKLFTLERVNKAPASFDPKKLWAFQDRHMRTIPTKRKVPLVLSYLQDAGLVSSPPPCDIGPFLARIVDAAGDRIKTAGDILQFTEFFVSDEQFACDPADFKKHVEAPGARELLSKFSETLAACEPFTAGPLEECLKKWLEAEGLKIGQLIHPLRVATTGKSVGLGLYEALELLGRDRCLARIRRAIS